MFVCLWALLLGCSPSTFFSLSQGLWWKCCSCLSLLHHLYTVVPGIHILLSLNLLLCSPSPSPSSALSFVIIFSLQTSISCDTMHHGPSLCMDCVPLAQTSGRWASVTLCLMLYSKWGCRDLTSAIPKQKSKYLTFDKCRYQRYLSVLCLSPFSLFHPAACVLRDKPSTGFSPSLSNSKA